MIYEVNLFLQSEISEAYLQWLPGHIAEMLAFPGFCDARTYRVDTQDPMVAITVQYKVTDRALLDRYLLQDAPRMREQAKLLFGDRFTASRRVLETL